MVAPFSVIATADLQYRIVGGADAPQQPRSVRGADFWAGGTRPHEYECGGIYYSAPLGTTQLHMFLRVAVLLLITGEGLRQPVMVVLSD